MANNTVIDMIKNNTITFGRQSTDDDQNYATLSWNTYLKNNLYLDVSSSTNAYLTSLIHELGWDDVYDVYD